MYMLIHWLVSTQSPDHIWEKMEYIQTFAEWLYGHQYPVEDVLSQLKWVLSLLLETKEGGEEGDGGGEGEGTERDGEGGERRSMSSVCVLEKAVEVLVKMARLQGRGSGGHRESCLAALAYCHLIWKVSI